MLYSKLNQGDLPAFMKSSSSPVVVNEESAKQKQNKKEIIRIITFITLKCAKHAFIVFKK